MQGIVVTLTIHVKPGGEEFEANAGERVLDAAIRAGHVLAHSCRAGRCGACKGRVLSGRVDYGAATDSALTEADRAEGYALFCQATPLSDLTIEAKVIAGADIPVRTLPCRVTRMEHYTDEIMGLSLKLAAGQTFKFRAGQYIDILLKGGAHRSFSLANAPHEDECLQLQIRHVPGGRFTSHVFTEMAERDLLRFNGPLGTFFVRKEDAAPIVMVAGGTGIAPIRGMLADLFEQGDTHEIHLYWAMRKMDDFYLDDVFRAWATAHPNFHYTPVCADPEEEGPSGPVQEVLIADLPVLSEHALYVSGSPAMVEAVSQAGLAHGLSPDRLYSDAFEFAERQD